MLNESSSIKKKWGICFIKILFYLIAILLYNLKVKIQ